MDTPLNCISEYKQHEINIHEERVGVISNARIVWADHKKIMRDFPQLFPAYSENACPSIIYAWLKHHCAVISLPQIQWLQAQQFTLHVSDYRKAYRPPRYGRALVLQNSDYPFFYQGNLIDNNSYLLDVKGVGVGPNKQPAYKWHQNGLLHLHVAIKEVIMQGLIEKIFEQEQLNVKGVPVYAILDLGFSTRDRIDGFSKFKTEHTARASVLVRKAHIRPPGNIELPNDNSELQQVYLAVELALRQYGLTSTGSGTRLKITNDRTLICEYAGQCLKNLDQQRVLNFFQGLDINIPAVFDAVNIQATRFSNNLPLDVRLIDFGHYTIKPQFDNPLLSLVNDRYLNWGGCIYPGDQYWVDVRPNKALNFAKAGLQRVPDEIGKHLGLEHDSQLIGVDITAAEIAQHVEKGLVTIADVEQMMDDFIDKLFH